MVSSTDTVRHLAIGTEDDAASRDQVTIAGLYDLTNAKWVAKLFDFTVRGLPVPGHVSPEDWFMKRFSLPHGARIHTIVEENDQRASPVLAN